MLRTTEGISQMLNKQVDMSGVSINPMKENFDLLVMLVFCAYNWS
jgi:hypothetical protein